MKKLVRFLLPHLHPDITVSPEGGTCKNAYVGRLGFSLLASKDDVAGSIHDQLECAGNRQAGISTFLADDLRLARWSCLPLIRLLLTPDTAGPEPRSRPLEALYPRGWTSHAHAGLCAFHGPDLHVHVAAGGGGVTRVFLGSRLVAEDLGIDITNGDQILTTRIYNPKPEVRLSGETVQIEVPLVRARFLSPGFLSRLVLRIGSTTAWSSRLLRSAIDVYRTRKSTAVNQSAASVGDRSSGTILTRSVSVSDGQVILTDLIATSTMALDSTGLRTHLRMEGETVGLAGQTFSGSSSVRIVKRFTISGNGVQVLVHVESTETP
jgi:hypothetical protein